MNFLNYKNKKTSYFIKTAILAARVQTPTEAIFVDFGNFFANLTVLE